MTNDKSLPEASQDENEARPPASPAEQREAVRAKLNRLVEALARQAAAEDDAAETAPHHW